MLVGDPSKAGANKVRFAIGAVCLLAMSACGANAATGPSASSTESMKQAQGPAPTPSVVPKSSTESSPRPTLAPAAPGTVPATASNLPAPSRALAAGSANDVIYGISLTVKNSTGSLIAVTFMYEGAKGGQAQWTWVNPGQSTSASNATSSGPDIWNSYAYIPGSGKQIKFESKLAGFTGNTTVTVGGEETQLDRGQQVSKAADGQNYTVSRGKNDIMLPPGEWYDFQRSERPDMGLAFNN